MAPSPAPESLDELAQRLRDGGWQEAAAGARRLLARDPQSAPALRLLSEALLQGGDHGALVAALEPYVRSGLKETLLLFRYAAGRAALGDHRIAVRLYRRIVEKQPDHVEAWLNLGVSLKALGQAGASIAAYRRALQLQPTLPQAHNNLGLALQQQGDHRGAVAALEEALRLKPDYARAYANLAQSLLRLDRIAEAEAAGRRATELAPDLADGYINLGMVLMAQNRQEETVAVFRRVVALQPDDPKSLSNLGVALKECGLIEEALVCQMNAQALAPDDPTPRWNEAHIRLLLGDFALGWERYESRWGTGDFKSSLRPFKEPFWQGEPIGHRAILIHVEQGVGDTVQFCRYLPLLAAQHPTAEIVLEVQASTVALLGRSFAALPRLLVLPHVNKIGINLTPRDLQLPLIGLPRLLGTQLQSIPGDTPYLTAASPRRYRRPEDSLVVGLSWKSIGATGRKRSLPLERLAGLLAGPGVRLVDLQYGDTAEERAALERTRGIVLQHDEAVDARADLDAFADQVAGCDLVVSIDNTTVHVAGALGVPCWVLLPFIPDFRWMLQREDSPWYPTLKLYRPPALNAWEALLERLQDDFAALLAGDRGRLAPRRWEGPPALAA